MNQPYSNYLNRIDVIKKNTEHLVKRVHELEEDCRRLRINKETYDLRDQARERVLKEIAEKQVRAEDLPPAQEIKTII